MIVRSLLSTRALSIKVYVTSLTIKLLLVSQKLDLIADIVFSIGKLSGEINLGYQLILGFANLNEFFTNHYISVRSFTETCLGFELNK